MIPIITGEYNYSLFCYSFYETKNILLDYEFIFKRFIRFLARNANEKKISCYYAERGN